jgi:class 3 adenylate cyclase/tetratricopeptide (TPR) repeat protein
MRICPSCGEENPGHAKFCLHCGAPLAAATPAAPSEERRVVTAVFTDIVGSTTRAETLDPEDVRSYLAPYYARVKAELEHFGGTVEKFIGDAVVALFGAPVVHEDDALRAVRAALAIKHAIADLNAHDEWLDLHIRIGVNTGEALVVLGAHPGEGEGMAAGDVLNTAARLQSAAPVDGILVGAETHRATVHAIEYRDVEPVTAKGKAERIVVWEALGERDVTPAVTSGPPLVGRSDELQALRELWTRVVADDAAATAIVVAPPGVGKSRLLWEFTRTPLGAHVHWGRCLAYGEGITYWPIAEIVKDIAGILVTDEPATASAKLDALLERIGQGQLDELRTMAAALANLLGVPTTPRGTYSAAEITQGELQWGIRRVFERLAAEGPVVLVIEDLHWAEPTLLELIEFLERAEAPLLVLASARPEVAEASPVLLADRARRRVIELRPLTDSETESLLGELLGPAALPRAALARLLRHAGGNPLFLEETVRMLADRGLLQAGAAELDSLPVPTSLQSLIGSRLDRLESADKRVAQHAAVVGTVFWPGAVEYVEERDNVEPRLHALVRHDFVRENESSTVAGEREYAFRHVLTRDVAYGQLPKGRRAALHVRCADWISALPAAVDEYIEIVAYHLEQACLLAREVVRSPVEPPVAAAVQALTAAAEKAERREGIREADRFYARALGLLHSGDEGTAIDLRLRRVRTLVALGELGRAHEQLSGVAEEAAAAGRLDLRCAAQITLGNIDWRQGRGADARRRLTEAQALAAELDDPRLGVRAAYELGVFEAWIDGEPDRAIETLRGSLAVGEDLGDRPLRIEGHMRLASVLFNAGAIAEADEEIVRCLALAGELGSRRDEARATSALAAFRYYRGPLEDAEELATQALEWLERICDTLLQVQNLRTLAKLALARNEPERAEARLREALPLALEHGGWLVPEVYRYLTQALVAQGRAADAAELAAFAERDAPREDPSAYAALLITRATAAAARGDLEQLTRCYEEAIGVYEEQSQFTDLAETRLEFARALVGVGEHSAALEQLDHADRLAAALGAGGLCSQIEALREAAGPAAPAPPSLATGA